jgi:hypothetical protein
MKQDNGDKIPGDGGGFRRGNTIESAFGARAGWTSG